MTGSCYRLPRSAAADLCCESALGTGKRTNTRRWMLQGLVSNWPQIGTAVLRGAELLCVRGSQAHRVMNAGAVVVFVQPPAELTRSSGAAKSALSERAGWCVRARNLSLGKVGGYKIEVISAHYSHDCHCAFSSLLPGALQKQAVLAGQVGYSWDVAVPEEEDIGSPVCKAFTTSSFQAPCSDTAEVGCSLWIFTRAPCPSPCTPYPANRCCVPPRQGPPQGPTKWRRADPTCATG